MSVTRVGKSRRSRMIKYLLRKKPSQLPTPWTLSLDPVARTIGYCVEMKTLLLATLSILGILSPVASTVAQDDVIRVMSFNVRYGTAADGDNAWPLRRDLVFETIRGADPHIIGIQEALAFQIAELERALPGFQRVGVGRDDGDEAGEFSAIMFRSDRFELLDSGTFWFSDTPALPGSMHWGNRITRICTWVRIRDRNAERSFYVYNLHWDHESQNSREMSARLLMERVDQRSAPNDPAIITGDFNAGESNAAFTFITSQGFRDTFRLRHPEASAVGTFNAFRGESDGEKIDAVLISPGWFVISAEIVRANRNGRFPSDHFPVTAEVLLLD